MKKNKQKVRVQTAKTPAKVKQASSKVPQPRNQTPELCKRLRRDMTKTCLGVAKTYGLTVKGGELSDIDLRHGFNINFRVGILMEDGAIYSPEKAMLEVLAPHFGLKPSDYDRH